MSLLSKGGDWEAHPQGLWIGTLIEVKPTQDTYGPKIRWVFETNCRDDEGAFRKTSMKSSYKGLGHEKATITKIIQAFGYDVNDAYWLSFDDLGGFQFMIDEGKKLGLNIIHFDKDDGTKGDRVAEVMTLDQLEERKAQLRASLEAMDTGTPATKPASPNGNGNGHAPAPSRPGTAGPARVQAAQPIAASAGGAPHPADAPSFDDPFQTE